MCAAAGESERSSFQIPPEPSSLPCRRGGGGSKVWEGRIPASPPPAQERGRLCRARPTAASLSVGAQQQKREGALLCLLPAGAQCPCGLLHQGLRGDQRGEVSVGGGASGVPQPQGSLLPLLSCPPPPGTVRELCLATAAVSNKITVHFHQTSPTPTPDSGGVPVLRCAWTVSVALRKRGLAGRADLEIGRLFCISLASLTLSHQSS